jgi:hypothetical protein
MGLAITTAFFMPCLKRHHLERLMRALGVGLLLWLCAAAHAQTQVEVTQFDVERSAEQIALSTQLQFELPPAVEDALIKGVPIYFKADAELYKERWYWYDKSVASVSRSYKLAFQPLTRRWRLSVAGGGVGTMGQGLGLSQSFESLAGAIDYLKRISKWRIAGSSELDPTGRYRLEFRFQLDISQLPRPFQIGVLGQSDWDISFARSTLLSPEAVK